MSEQTNSKGPSLQTLRRLLLVLVCVWLSWFVYQNRDEFRIPAGLTSTTLVALYSGFLLQMVCFAGMFRLMLKRVGADSSYPECLMLTLGSSLLNMILPARAGAAYRAAFLRSRYHVSLTDFLATLAAFYLLSLAVHSLAGLVACAAMYVAGDRVPHSVVTVLAVSSALSCYLLFGRQIATLANSETLPSPVSSVASRALRFRDHLNPVWPLLGFAVISTLITYWQTIWLFSAVSAQASGSGIVLYSSIRTITMLVPLTPGSLGITEGAAVYLGSIIGYTDVAGLTMQALTRAVALSSLVLAGTPSLLWLRFHESSTEPCLPVSPHTLSE